jgi:hypothetical protein
VEPLECRRLLTGPSFAGNPVGLGLTDVTYHGGPLLQNVQVESVYYGAAWLAPSATPNATNPLPQLSTQLDGFLKYFVTSPYMNVLKQYNVSDGTFVAHDFIAQGPTGSNLDDSQIRAALNAEIAAQHVAAPTLDSLYVFFAPPGVTVTANGQSSVHDFAGYHDVFTDSAGVAVYYVVVPYPAGDVVSGQLNPFQQQTLILSHEVSEAITDPDTQTGWFDPVQGEIGDVAVGRYGLLDGYVVQAVWSQADGEVVLPTDTTTSTLHVGGVPVHAIAGQSFTSVVATIVGTDAIVSPGSLSATIDWGDGHTSAGTITADPNGGFDVSGTYTYVNEGWYPVTVTIDDASGTVVGTALTKASVAPPPPTIDADGVKLDATAGQQFSGVVAHFTDVNAGATTADFTATIDWGDGTSSAGTISADPNGGFDVNGTHTYSASQVLPPGPTPLGNFGFDFFGLPPGILGRQFFVVTVAVTDTTAHATAVARSFAAVAPAPPSITAQGENIQATTGQPFTGVVAKFTDVNASAATGDFTASIDWGDGTSSAGTISADPNGGFDVTGTHTYTDQSIWDGVGSGFGLPFHFGLGNQFFVVRVGISDTATGDQAATRSLATVAPAPPNLAVTADNIAATAGQPFSGQVATFTDVNPSATTGDFTASIDWGDGTSSAGTISADPNGGFDVTGTHTYATGHDPFPVWAGLHFGFGDEGFPLTVTVTGTTGEGVATGRAIADVAPAPADVQATGTQIQAVEGKPFSGTVATFTAADPAAATGDFTASIDWGDGTTSDGTVVADPAGGFDVTGTHTYTQTVDGDVGSDWHPGHNLPILFPGPGTGGESFVVIVTIHDVKHSSVALALSFATVTPTPPNITTAGQNLHLSAGQASTGTVVTFADANGDAAASFTATINWGDGTVTDGTVTADANGGFDVTGTHTYRDGGTFPVFVRIHDTKDGDTAVNLSFATVADSTPPSALTTVALAFAQSAESYGDTVIKDYQQYLGRTASAAEIAGWVGAMQNGVTADKVMAAFLSSPEFYARAGSTNQAWLDALYQNLLGRNADAGGAAASLRALAAGVSRSAIVMVLATSQERQALLVQNDYQQFLGRTASAGEVGGWVNALQHGVSDAQVVAAFLGSQEYFQKQGANASDWLTSAYENVLARKPDPSGFQGWLGVLHALGT